MLISVNKRVKVTWKCIFLFTSYIVCYLVSPNTHANSHLSKCLRIAMGPLPSSWEALSNHVIVPCWFLTSQVPPPLCSNQITRHTAKTVYQSFNQQLLHSNELYTRTAYVGGETVDSRGSVFISLERQKVAQNNGFSLWPSSSCKLQRAQPIQVEAAKKLQTQPWSIYSMPVESATTSPPAASNSPQLN